MKSKILFFATLAIIGAQLFSNQINLSFDFDKPIVSKNIRADYDKIELNNCNHISNPGYPDLPFFFNQIILPPGQIIDHVEVVTSALSQSRYNLNIIPSQQPYPLSYKGEISFTSPNIDIYGKDEFYPQSIVTSFSTHFYRGVSIGHIQISPLQYNPVTNEVTSLENIQLKIYTVDDPISQRAYTDNYIGKQSTIDKLAKENLSNEYLSAYSTQSYRTLDNDYIIITEENYVSDFDDFVAWKTTQGYNVLVKTTEDIYSQYTGVDNAEKIRNFIIYAYQNLGAEYVLLGGDIETIPHRGMYLAAGSTIDEDLPSDLYYAGLDNNGTGAGPGWNADNDSYWGEPAEADYYAEVFIGRISADSHAEFSAALNKQIMYQSQPVTENLLEAIMIGEELDSNPTYGGDYKDEIVDGGTYNSYYTVPFGSNFNISTHYDRDETWYWSDLKDSFNAGTHLVNHLGHSSVSYNMKFSTSYVTNTNLTSEGIDRGFYIIYSQGCYPGAFDNRDSYGYYGDDCIVEAFTTIENGCVAFLGNTRYGWYNPSGTNSSSQYLDRQFFDAIFGESIYGLAPAHEDSRFEGASQCDGDPWFRWSFYEVTVFGDPSLDVWTAIPSDFTVTHNPSIPLGASQVSINTDTAGANVALVQAGVLIGRGTTGATGDLICDLDQPVNSLDVIDIYVNGHNMNQYQNEILVISNQPYIIHQEHILDDALGNGNNEADFGETLNLDFTFQNVGNQVAYNAIAQLTTSDSYVTITDGTETLGTIDAESEIEVNNCFAFQLSSDIPDQHQIDFILTVAGNSRDEWSSYFSIIANAPTLSLEGITIDDSMSGNGNGRLDPGETAEVSITCLNSGHIASPSALVLITTNSSYLTINSSSDNIGAIGVSNEIDAQFSVSVDVNTPIGTPLDIITDLVAGSYELSDTYFLPAGLILEDFESGNFNSFPWVMAGDTGWLIDTSNPQEGIYAGKSGVINHSGSSEITLTANVLSAGDISFYGKVSSESGYDFLRFYIDNSMQGEWSGTVDWSQYTYSVDAGEHTFKWSYEKDTSVNNGDDCGWIDYIIFPSIEIPNPPSCDINTNSFDFALEVDQNTSASFSISNSGDSDLIFSITKEFLESTAIYLNGRSQGGPDDFGYIWKDSNEADGPDYNWQDISDSGTEISFYSNDIGSDLIDFGFDFPFYGVDYTQFRINPNGWIGFGADNTTWSNQSLPSSSGPLPAIFPFWDDLHPYDGSNGSGTVYYQLVAGQLIVQFEEVQHYGTYTTGTYTFQMIINSDGNIKMQYHTLTGTYNSCTVGIQNADASVASQMIYNSTYLEDNLAVEITPPLSWLNTEYSNGTIVGGSNKTIQLDIDSQGLETGDYLCNLNIATNDPANSLITIPVSLNVSTGFLDTPQNLIINIDSDTINLSWDSVNGATSYNIYGSNEPDNGFGLLGTTSNTSWSESGTSHKFYQVTAVN